MKKLEFVNNASRATDPIEKTKELAFRDIVFKEDYREKKAKFGQGTTWVRFLPSIKPSVYDWMMPIEIHQDINGTTFCSPKTLDSNTENPFEAARNWFNRNNKGALQSKEKNPNGLRLYSKRMGIAWLVNGEAPEGQRLKIFYASLYDGVRGGTTGLGYNVRYEANSRDTEPNSPTFGKLIHGDITDPTAGRLVKIERNLSDKSEYASYKAGIGKNPAPVEEQLAQLTEEEIDLIVPLERLVYIPSTEEQLDILRKYIGEKFFYEIFGNKSVGVGQAEATTIIPTSEKTEVQEKPNFEKEPTSVPNPVSAPVSETETKPAEETEPVSEELYKAREVTSLIGKNAEGIRELLKNKHRLSKTHLEIVIESANEEGVDLEEFGLA